MGLGVWIGVAVLGANAAVVVLAVIAGRRRQPVAPPPGSPRARHLNGSGGR